MARDSLERIEVADRDVDIARVLGNIDMDNLIREVAESNGYSIWYAILQAEADAAVERTKQSLEYREAEVAAKFRQTSAQNDKKITENMVHEHLVMHGDILDLKMKLIDAQRKAAIMRGVSYALTQKARTLEKMTFLIGQEHGASEPLRKKMREDAQRDGSMRRRQPV